MLYSLREILRFSRVVGIIIFIGLIFKLKAQKLIWMDKLSDSSTNSQAD